MDPATPQLITLTRVGQSPRGPINPQTARRSTDRWITTAAIAIAAVYAGLALLSIAAPPEIRQGWWLPLHLLLAGGATAAISGVMPFFSAAVASVPPAPTALRITGVAGIAIGAIAVVLVRIGTPNASTADVWPGVLAGGIYLIGIAGVALSTVLPLRLGLGPRRIIMGVSYGAALVCIALGATIGTLFIAGVQPVLSAWDVLRPAHAWLNAFGFLSLVIAASLLHLLPTVVGTRIARSRASMIVLVGFMTGPLIAALGFILRIDLLALAGALLLSAGALGLIRHTLAVLNAPSNWTTDLSWHRFARWSLVCAVGWFAVAAAAATWTIIQGGATGRGWNGALLIAPLALGWAAQTLIGAWTHLIPSIGPGSQPAHARQRTILAIASIPRLVAFQIGVALLAIGLPTSSSELQFAGVVLIAPSIAIALGVLARALLITRSTSEPAR